MTTLVAFVTRRNVAIAGAFLVGIPLLVILAWLYHDGIQMLLGSPYDRRAQGAAGICDWQWVPARGESWTKLYRCADEDERLAAAANVDGQDWILAAALSILTILIPLAVICRRELAEWWKALDDTAIISDNDPA